MAPPKHRRPSSVDRLGKEAIDLIGKLRIDEGWTIDQILAKLKELGKGDVSRSALGRKIKSIEEIGAQLRESRNVATALMAQVGDAPEDRTAELNIELMHSMVLRLVTATNDEGDGQPVTFDPKDVLFLANSLNSLAGARKTNADMLLKVRQEAAKEAVKKVETVGKSQGLTSDTIDLIRHAVLGTTT